MTFFIVMLIAFLLIAFLLGVVLCTVGTSKDEPAAIAYGFTLIVFSVLSVFGLDDFRVMNFKSGWMAYNNGEIHFVKESHPDGTVSWEKLKEAESFTIEDYRKTLLETLKKEHETNLKKIEEEAKVIEAWEKEFSVEKGIK